MFHRVACVTLDRRPERYQEFLDRMPDDQPFGEIERFSAVDGERCPEPDWWKSGAGAWGCLRSHLTIIEQCLNQGTKNVLLFEDDAAPCKDLVKHWEEYESNVPDDWDMMYLGGQHLQSGREPPLRINDHVYEPYNINRTHAFAINGKFMRYVYQYLSAKAWSTAHHIDHRLGAMHKTKKYRIYCPRKWIFGQMGGDSDVSRGKHFGLRFWPGADETEKVKYPFVLVLGIHRSGSSVIAGVLHNLGIHMGNKLIGYENRGTGGFEAEGLAKFCERVYPFPSIDPKVKFDIAKDRLFKWIKSRTIEAEAAGLTAGGKYPQMCFMSEMAKTICGDDLRIVNCERPLQDSIKSMQSRCKGRHDAKVVEAHQRALHAAKEEFLAKNEHLTVNYAKLLEDPKEQVKRICNYLGLTPPSQKMAAAINLVDPRRKTY